jgi:excisionase family DNA binding protein
MDKPVYTTGKIAKLCGVSPNTVSRWCNEGLLPCYRVPGSSDRRITSDALIAFMKARGIPLDAVIDPRNKLLVQVSMAADVAWFQQLFDVLPGDQFKATVAADEFAAGMSFACEKPDVVILDATLGRGGIMRGCALFADWRAASPKRGIVVIAAEDAVDLEVLQDAADAVFKRPVSPSAVATTIMQIVSQELPRARTKSQER